MMNSYFRRNYSCSCVHEDKYGRKGSPQGRPDSLRVGMRSVVALMSACLLFAIFPLQVGGQSSTTAQSKTVLTESRSESTLAADRDLYEAAEAGDIAKMEKLVGAGAALNAAIPGDGSPLIAAARNDRLGAVQWLLDHGADPNMSVRGDGSPLIVAARLGHIDVMKELLDRGANINQIVSGDENALIRASGSGHLDAVKLLVSRGADSHVRVWAEEAGGHKGEWRSPLSMARQNGHSDVVNYFLSIGVRD